MSATATATSATYLPVPPQQYARPSEQLPHAIPVSTPTQEAPNVQLRAASDYPPSQQRLHPAAAASARPRRRGPGTDGIIGPLPGASKIGPQRTTKNVQKLKILPSPDQQQDEESGREVYSQVTRIKDYTARRDAERLGKAERAYLPRVTAYCTANAYKMDGLLRYLKARAQTRGAAPKQFDECIYTPYSYQYVDQTRDQEQHQQQQQQSTMGPQDQQQGDLIDLQSGRTTEVPSTTNETTNNDMNDTMPTTNLAGQTTEPSNNEPNANDDDDDRRSVLSIMKSQPQTQSEVFLFNYGVVVLWGMSPADEKRFLKELAKFETEKLADEDVQVENFNYYITDSYQPRIYNDFITLNNGRNYMIKVAISHAIAQSVKISLFEDLVENTIEETKGIPQEIAMTGKVKMGRRTIMMHIGELFILRININLQGSVLDSPELMWSEPELEPTYAAARSYLEINQRVSLLNQRLDVIGDLLQMLKEQLSHAHGEYLEWIVIILIAAEIFVGLVNIAVDILADATE